MATFRTRARTVDMLGRQQIAGVPNAISELFKNAHDAYADHVEIDYFMEDGLFVLRDDGIGMTREEFEQRWLTIGTESKLKEEDAPRDPEKPERPISGEKGIGRLAIAAIGPQVLILTRSVRSGERHNLVMAFIHWGLFELPKINLDEIDIPIKEIPEGRLPQKADVDELLMSIKEQLKQYCECGRVDEVTSQKIQADLDRFDFNIDGISSYLSKLDSALTFENDGRGTHFFISPVVDTLKEDIELDARETGKISTLSRQMVGFADTMTPDNRPAIVASFRYWQNSQYPKNDILNESEFWSPEDLDRADIRISGKFDKYGRFRGHVQAYRNEPIVYELPWSKSQGKETSCGPFSIELGYIAGRQRDSALPPDEYANYIRRLDRISGFYMFRDGIRILPYGDVEFDWLQFEQRRNLSASYYLFSHRRMS